MAERRQGKEQDCDPGTLLANGLCENKTLTAPPLLGWSSVSGTFDCYQNNRRLVKWQLDKSGNLWANIGMYLGLIRMDMVTTFIHHFEHNPENPNSLADNAVFPIIEDSDGYIWIGTLTVIGADNSNGGLSTSHSSLSLFSALASFS